jgi:hypothetical protein
LHPTVGPTDLPLATPEMRPQCCETKSLFASDQKRRLQSFLFAITDSTYCQSCPLASAPPQSLLPHALSSCKVACGAITLALASHDGSTDGRFTSPSLINSRGAINLPVCEAFNSGPASRFWFSEPVESKYGINSRWKLTPPFQVPSTAIVVSFLHIPSQQSCNKIHKVIHIYEFSIVLGQSSYFY